MKDTKMKKPNECQNMDDIRIEIDRIDKELISLISKRAGYVNRAADFKKSETDVKAPKRVEKMLVQRKTWAEEKNINPNFIEKLFSDMVNYFINKEMQEWKIK